jgi:hypothetical protein
VKAKKQSKPQAKRPVAKSGPKKPAKVSSAKTKRKKK